VRGMGKGSKVRQGNEERFRENYDKIFNKPLEPVLRKLKCMECHQEFKTVLNSLDECDSHDKEEV
jgi:hypothetical protein